MDPIFKYGLVTNDFSVKTDSVMLVTWDGIIHYPKWSGSRESVDTFSEHCLSAMY